MAAIYRDSDGDSLSDIFKVRIGLNPENPDTDGDGMTDNRDSVPTREYDVAREGWAKAYALLSILENRDAGQVRIAGSPQEGLVD